MARPVIFLDVFAARPLEGNCLAVILQADGVSDEQMLALARETRLAETTFVQSSESANYRNRIWTVVEEVPFAGHPTLGTAVAVAIERGTEEASFVQETQSGLTTVSVRRSGASWRAEMQVASYEEDGTVPSASLMTALGLPPESADRDLEPRFASIGLATLIVPVSSAEFVAQAQPDRDAIAALPRPIGAFNFYLLHVEKDSGEVCARSIPCYPEEAEDPATGSAAGALAGYLAARTSLASLHVRQGVEIGRPSEIFTRHESGRITVGGAVHVLIEGTIHL